MKRAVGVLLGVACLFQPIRLSAESAREEGRVFFTEKGCSQCHSINGAGGTKGPVLDGVGKRLTKEAIANQIRNGSLVMPAFGDALTPEEVAAIAEFLHKSTKPLLSAKAH